MLHFISKDAQKGEDWYYSYVAHPFYMTLQLYNKISQSQETF